jgi:hypothetical protein
MLTFLAQRLRLPVDDEASYSNGNRCHQKTKTGAFKMSDQLQAHDLTPFF